ncbi:ExbD/TolR family protein [Balneola vulgaris]|uniref:ExbD/TolR family protein n=1 Tax=Balneola vulgaris TaxID=287535 RepID=UPI000364E9CE|nr:biopolymer transporter ExbD [Balneola vulgaris]
MLLKKRKREGAEINGSSMADIAFLLLIFFLVTTTINVDTGIGMVLPPPLNPEDQPPPIRERNLMKIVVNENGLVLMDEELTPMEQVQEKIIEFIKNPENLETLSVSPQAAIVSIKTVRQTPYSIYIDMLDEVIGAYAILRNEAALANYGVEYSRLSKENRDIVEDIYPKKISIAEPDKE